MIGPGGVVVIDSKQYRGRLRLDQDGFLWHGRHLLVSTLRRVRWEADQADQVLGIADLNVGAIVAVQGASVPGAAWRPTGSPSPPPAEFPTCCGPCRPSLGPSAWPGWPTPGPATLPPRCLTSHNSTATACRSRWMTGAVAKAGGCPRRAWPVPGRGAYVNPYAHRMRTPGVGG